jgi:ATP-dependent Clp protease ATP-binding subunit ClpC
LRRTIQREIEDVLSEKILFGDVRPGQIVLVDTEGEGDEAIFTFVGEQKASLPDEPLVEAAVPPTGAATPTPEQE